LPNSIDQASPDEQIVGCTSMNNKHGERELDEKGANIRSAFSFSSRPEAVSINFFTEPGKLS
jgi:hypothetical protein